MNRYLIVETAFGYSAVAFSAEPFKLVAIKLPTSDLDGLCRPFDEAYWRIDNNHPEVLKVGSMLVRYFSGEQIDIFTTPDALRGQLDPQAGNGPTMEVLLQKSGRVWVGVHYGLNSSEGWWYDPVYCPIWSAVLPEVCQ